MPCWVAVCGWNPPDNGVPRHNHIHRRIPSSTLSPVHPDARYELRKRRQFEVGNRKWHTVLSLTRTDYVVHEPVTYPWCNATVTRRSV